MGKLQRDRGAAFENELANYLTEVTGIKHKRILGQARDAGSDILYRGYVIEAKRRRELAFEKWFTQAINSKQGKPVVVARADHGISYAILPFEEFVRLVELVHLLDGR